VHPIAVALIFLLGGLGGATAVPKLILDLCGGTGAWSRPYKDAGCDVYVVTLPDYDVTDVTITHNSVTFHPQRSGIGPLRIPLVRIHGILAAPPCDQFSLANTRSTYRTTPNWSEGLVAVNACLAIIQAAMAKGYMKFWALENPFGHLRKFLGVPGYTFEAWWFDADVPFVKRTDLWGYYTRPVATVTDKPARLTNSARDSSRNTKGWYAPEVPAEYAHLALDRKAVRAITPRGFAQAFWKANK